MPRYFFHVIDGDADRDLEGSELPNLKAAKREAQRCVGTMMSDAALISDPPDEWNVEVADSAGLVLFRVNATVVDAVERH